MEQRTKSKWMDENIGLKIPVLDDGFVSLVNYMGTEDSIVQAARVSYGKGTKSVNDDIGLIRYLMRHSHTTPFEMCELTLHIRVPMDCWRQFVRHRTANINEYSTRYSEAIDSQQKTLPDKWRYQSGTNKQGSSGYLPERSSYDIVPRGYQDDMGGAYMSDQEAELHELARKVYKERLDAGVAREQARKDLPLSTYTEAYWKIDLHNLLHFLRLRLDKHAQEEIRNYANVISHIVSMWVPNVWRAFEDYKLNALSFSAREIGVLKQYITNNRGMMLDYATAYDWLKFNDDKTLKPNRERQEFEEKLSKLGITIQWFS